MSGWSTVQSVWLGSVRLVWVLQAGTKPMGEVGPGVRVGVREGPGTAVCNGCRLGVSNPRHLQ